MTFAYLWQTVLVELCKKNFFLNFKRQAYFLIYKVVLLLTPRSHRKVNANKNDKNNNKNNNIHIITYKMKISRPYV